MTKEEAEARRLKAFEEYWEQHQHLRGDVNKSVAQTIYEHGWLDRGLADVELHRQPSDLTE